MLQDTIREAGAQAYEKGVAVSECPFRYASKSRLAWKTGWWSKWEKDHPGMDHIDAEFEGGKNE